MRDLVMDYGVFPSPLGEMGLSIQLLNLAFAMQVSDGFRPLSGKWGYRLTKPAIELSKTYVFPSPLGEMGLSIVLTIRAQRDNC